METLGIKVSIILIFFTTALVSLLVGVGLGHASGLF
jgi:hypothetical protein